MTVPGEIPVRNNSAESRYEATAEGRLCIADYLLEDDRVIFTHTFVPPELRGRGIAEQVVRFALADVRSQGLKVTPACSYVARFIDRHAEYQDLPG